MLKQKKITVHLLLCILSFTGAGQVYAQSLPSDVLPNRTVNESLEKQDFVVPDIDAVKKENLSEVLPSELEEDSAPITFTPEYLQQHPEELEALLMELIRQYNTDGLKLLLPIYATVPNHDPSVIDWGNALIAMNEGKVGEAVTIYRKMIAALPDHKVLRFQLAVALYRNGEFIAARDQFEKMRSIGGLSQEDIKLMDSYIANIDKKDEWSFDGSLSYLDNQNLNSSPKAGTKVKIGNSVLTNTKDPISGQGFSYSFGADKKWALDDKTYFSFGTNINGEHYFNASDYNNLSIRTSTGLGYRTSRFNFEISPFLQKQWYGGGSIGKGHLSSYVSTPGVRIESGYWFSPRLKYQGALQFGKDNYVSAYDQNDGNNILLSNTLLFSQNQKRFFFAGLDGSFKDAKSDDLAYHRYGIRAGWTEEWSKGISTRLNLGFAKRYYQGKDFFAIKRINDEYNAGLTVWHRGLHFYGITPRLIWSYNKTNSNNPLYDYDNHKVFLDFTKTF